MNWNEVPNLQLICERFFNEIKEDDKKINLEILGVFTQSWPNNAGLFENGNFSGQCISTYYTTVVYESFSDCYGIFQNNNLVYIIKGTNENLLNDIDNHTIKCLKDINYYTNGSENKI